MVHLTDANKEDLASANAQTVYEVTRDQLPLSCPTPEQRLWNSHPRVYLPIGETGEALCPYCSAQYRLVDRPAG